MQTMRFQGVDNLQKFKEQVIQNYLGTPNEILGISEAHPVPRECFTWKKRRFFLKMAGFQSKWTVTKKPHVGKHVPQNIHKFIFLWKTHRKPKTKTLQQR